MQEQKRISISNKLAKIFSLIMAGWAVTVLAVERKWMIPLWDSLFSLGFFLIPWINNKGHALFGRWLFIVLANGVIFLFPALFGESPGTHYAFLPATTLPFAFFETRHKGLIAFGVLLPMGLFILLQATDFNLFPHYGLLPPKSWVFWLTVLSSFLLSFFPIFTFSRANEKAEEELKATQDQRAKMVAASRLSSLGEMAGGIAHEINNPLTAIHFKTSLLIKKLENVPGTEEALGHLEEIKTVVMRIATIIEGLRRFSRDDTSLPLEEVRVNDLVADTLSFCQERFSVHGISLVVDAIPPDRVVLCRPVQISQILLNLLNNAFDATVDEKTGGKVRIETEESGKMILISVSDNGPGISEEIEKQIFTPFFTTKPFGQGTGLGLSVSRGMAEAHKGSLYFERLKSGGTRFTLALPGVLPKS